MHARRFTPRGPTDTRRLLASGLAAIAVGGVAALGDRLSGARTPDAADRASVHVARRRPARPATELGRGGSSYAADQSGGTGAPMEIQPGAIGLVSRWEPRGNNR